MITYDEIAEERDELLKIVDSLTEELVDKELIRARVFRRVMRLCEAAYQSREMVAQEIEALLLRESKQAERLRTIKKAAV